MSATLLLAAALMAQSAYGAAPASDQELASPQAYNELAAGAPETVKARIRANPAFDAGDPATLINLGAAYARAGDAASARECYLAAIASDTRLEVQLSDGRWMDSRRVARMAADALQSHQAVALR